MASLVSPRRRKTGAASLWVGTALLLVTSFLPGCGAGGGQDLAGSAPPPAVSIQTSSLPSAGMSAPYATTLSASGGTAPYAWSLTSGSQLPQGLALATSGLISGTPTMLGTFAFGVSVTDSSSPSLSDSAAYSIVVSTFDASVALLHVGDAWTGESYPLSAIGASSTTFTVVQNQSGGSITGASPSTSRATFVAGPGTGTDVVRATSGAGESEDLTIPVVTNPAANMTAIFSSTDVWHLRFDEKVDGSHAFDSDFHAALSDIGFRAATSTSSTGTAADELAELYARTQILRNLNVMYGNNADGSRASGGFAISFPFVEPDLPHVCPANGQVSSPAVNQFNVMSVLGGGEGGVIGTAYLDGTSNGAQENDTTTASAGELGVFVREIASFFNSAFHAQTSTLPGVAVGASDVAALKALLYGQANPGGRYLELKRIGEGFGKTVAAVAAHEIGHSLGLDHTSPSASGSIMNASAVIGPGASYSFVASDQALLANGLPGPGRGGSPLRVDALRWAAPGEGVEGATAVVCACRLHRRGR